MSVERSKLLDDCFAHDTSRLTHAEAISILRQRLVPVVATQTVTLDEASGRFCARDTGSPRTIPGHDNAAVDGYAFAASDHAATNGTFPVSDRIAAGESDVGRLADGTAVRIFTGAELPQGADTVAMQEDCTVSESRSGTVVTIPAGLRAGANRRRAGEDVATGDILVCEAQHIRPQEIAALASAGLAEVEVYNPLRIAVFSTGDEIVQPGHDLNRGQVYDANRFLLLSLLGMLPAFVTYLGVAPDDLRAVEGMLEDSAGQYDAILTTGGASRGEEDHLTRALANIGRRHLWQLAVKPGRPMCFGQIGDCAVFSLPGNPVAAFVCYLMYVRPSLICLGGGGWPEPTRFPVSAGFDFPSKKSGRREFWRGWLEGNAPAPVARKFEKDGSGLITGLRRASGLIEVDEDTTSIVAGDTVMFIPFSEFGIT